MLKSSAMHLFVVRLHSAGCILTQMQGRQASFSYLNSFLQQRCHYLWSHFFQSEVPAGLNDNGNFCMCSWQQICTRRLYNIIFIHDHLDVLLLTKTQIHPHTVWACWNISWFKKENKTKKKAGQKKNSTILKAYTQPPLFPTDSTLTQLESLREYTLSDQNNETTGLWKKVFSVNVEWTLEMEGFHLAQLWFI